MRAVGSFRGLPIEDPDALVDLSVQRPVLTPTDVLVAVDAVSVNPHDVQTRASLEDSDQPRILGYDAVGTVAECGVGQGRFSVGDRVFFAGDMRRQGANSEFVAVDARLAGKAPPDLTAADLAAMPLTAITAWECLFDHLRLRRESDGVLLVVGGAGGVPSILIQLAKKLTRLVVIGTAATDESRDWVRTMGADHVVDYTHDLVEQVESFAPDGVQYVFSSHSRGNIDAFGKLLAPFGHIVSIDNIGDDARAFDALQWKSVTWHLELMFARSIFGFDMAHQGDLLTKVGRLMAGGTVRTTRTETFEGLTADSLRRAHQRIETGDTIGKLVVTR